MKSINKIFFISLALFSAHLNCIENTQALYNDISKWAQTENPAQNANQSPEEKAFIEIVKDETSTDQKFKTFQSSMLESLKSNSTFISDILNIATKNSNTATLKGHYSDVQSVSFSRDGNYAISGSVDGKIKIWDVKDKQRPKELSNLKGPAVSHSVSVSFSPDGNYAISASNDDTIKLWDVKDKQRPKELSNLKGSAVSNSVSVSFSPDGNYAISGSADGKMRLWDLNNKKNLKAEPIATLNTYVRSDHWSLWVNSISFSPDGNYAISASNDDTIKLWDVRNKNNLNTNAIATFKGHNSWVNSVSFSPDGNYVISGSDDKTIKLWDVTDKYNPKELSTLKGHDGLVESVSFSPDGNYAISGSEDKTIKLWDIKTKQNPNPNSIATLNGHNGLVRSVSFSPDGNYSISGSWDNTIKLWDLSFLKIPDYLTKLVNSRDGILQYLLLSEVLEFRKKQKENPKPFSISDPKLKELFNNLPGVLKDSLIKENYIVLK